MPIFHVIARTMNKVPPFLGAPLKGKTMNELLTILFHLVIALSLSVIAYAILDSYGLLPRAEN